MTKTQIKKTSSKVALSTKLVIKKRTGNFTTSRIISPMSPSPKIPVPIQKRLLQGNLHLISDKMYADLKTAIKEKISMKTKIVNAKGSRLLEKKWGLVVNMVILRVKALQKTTKSSISALMEGLATKKTSKGSVCRKIEAVRENFSEQHDEVKRWGFEKIDSFLL